MPIGITLLAKDVKTGPELSPFLKKRGYNLLSLEQNGKNSLPPGCLEADLVLFETYDGDHAGLLHVKTLINNHNKPVIILTKQMGDLLRSEYYRLGVQDLITAPWFPKVLDVRIRAALRRAGYVETKNQIVQWQMGEDHLTLQTERHSAFLNGNELKLTFSQWNILSTLVGNGGVALSRSYLLRECLHFEQGDTRTLDNHIKNLRKVLGNSSSIETIHGYGYKLNGKQIKTAENSES